MQCSLWSSVKKINVFLCRHSFSKNVDFYFLSKPHLHTNATFRGQYINVSESELSAAAGCHLTLSSISQLV